MELHIGAKVTLAQTGKHGKVVRIYHGRNFVDVRMDDGDLVTVKTWAIESIEESC
jgi:translation initiation factor IF-1